MQSLLDQMSDVKTMHPDLDRSFDDSDTSSMEQEQKRLREENDRLLEEIETLKELQKKAVNDFAKERTESESTLKEQLSRITDDRDQLSIRVIELKQQAKKIEIEHRNENNFFQEEKTALELGFKSEKEQLEETIRTLKEECSRAETNRCTMELELTNLKKELGTLQHEKIQNASQVNSETLELMKQLREEKERLTEQSDAHTNEIEKLRRELMETNMKAIRLSGEKEQSETRLVPIANENAELKRTLAIVSDERDNMQIKLQGMTDLQNKLSQVKKEKEESAQKFKELKDSFAELNTKIHTLTDQKEQLTVQHRMLSQKQDRTAELEQVIFKLTREMKHKETEYNQMASNLTTCIDAKKQLELELITANYLQQELNKITQVSNDYFRVVEVLLASLRDQASLIGAQRTAEIVQEIQDSRHYDKVFSKEVFKNFEEVLLANIIKS
jgi:chromosome segregation ATPase